MAEIPYQAEPQVAARPIANAYGRQNFDTGLEKVATGLQQVGDTVEKQYQLAKAKADAVAANDAVAQYQHDNTTAFYGDSRQGAAAPNELAPGEAASQQSLDRVWSDENKSPAPQPLSRLRGKAAAEGSVDTLDWLEKRRLEIAEKLSNDKQRELFLQHSQDMFEQSRSRAEGHVSSEIQQAEVASLEGRKQVALTDIANNFADEKSVAEASAAVATTLHAFALSPEDGQAKVAAWNAEVAKVRLNQFFATKDWKGAQALFSKVKEQLGPQAPQFEKAIATLREDQQAEGAAAQLIERATDPENRRVNPNKAFAELDSIEDVPLRDEVRKRLEQRVAVAERDWTRRVSNVFDLALADYIKGGDNIYAVNSSAKAWLLNNAPKEWRQIENMAKSDKDAEKGAPPTPEQEMSMTRFLVDVNDHPEKYATMTTPEFNTQVRPLLAPRDREHAGAVLAQMHGKANKPEELGNIENRMLLQIGREAGVFDPKQNDVSKWDDESAQLYYRSAQALQENVASYRRLNGKAPPHDVVQGWARELFLKGKNPAATTLGFGGKTTRLEAEMKGTEFEPDWTSDDENKAKAALGAAGARVDEKSVEAYLRRRHRLPSVPTQAAPLPPPPSEPSNPRETGQLRPGEAKY